MGGKKYLIATACNQKYEDFLINHWLNSLKENVKLDEIDILIIDYGLTEKTVQELKKNNVNVKQAESISQEEKIFSFAHGSINNLRFLELKKYLEENNKYEQVILCDSGDIIFQTDISQLFQMFPEKIKGVYEDISPNMDVLVNDKNVANAKEIKESLKGKNLINVGFVVYPTTKFKMIVDEIFKLIKDKSAWGIETVLINYVIYTKFPQDFYELPNIYNFIPTTSTKKYKVKNGKFYIEDGTLIPVVHNAGGKNVWRPIRNFGYGNEFNQPRTTVI
ncbi:MAG: hypothetical protein ACK4E1_07490, partial [Fervidobacterium nodosum]